MSLLQQQNLVRVKALNRLKEPTLSRTPDISLLSRNSEYGMNLFVCTALHRDRFLHCVDLSAAYAWHVSDS